MAIYTDNPNDPKADRLAMYKPWSALVTDQKIYLPKGLTGVLRDRLGLGENAANVAAHTLMSAAVVAAGVGAARIGYGLLKGDSNDAYADLSRQLSGVRGAGFDSGRYVSKRASMRKSAKDDPGASLTRANFMSSFAPLAASALLAAGTYGLVDKLMDKRDAGSIGGRLDERTQLRNDLMVARAKLAKGQLSDAEYESLSSRFSKAASMRKGAGLIDLLDSGMKTTGVVEDKGRSTDMADVAWSSLGLLCAGLATAAGAGAYAYISHTDPNNLEYRAKKKGLEEYARARARVNQLTTRLTEGAADQERLFDAIDGKGGGSRPKVHGASVERSVTVTPEEGVRGGVTIDSTDINRPISITL